MKLSQVKVASLIPITAVFGGRSKEKEVRVIDPIAAVDFIR